MIRCLLGNGLWALWNARAWQRHRRALRDPRRFQEEILQRTLRRNADTEFGRRHQYAKIRSLEEFRDAVPVRSYDEFEPWIEGIRRGRSRVLTSEPVLMMEKTSGSSGPSKYIPYTRTLRREFQEAIGAWMFDLFTSRPALLRGAQYWSISPAAREKDTTPGGIPVGFDEDTEYLGGLERRCAGWVMAVPGGVGRIPDMEENRRVTLEHLARRRDLRFISVWNPSFLTILMRRLPAGLRPKDLWPRLALISCWTRAAAARFVPEMRSLFPGVEVQGKGLIATEGVVSFPLVGRPGAVPALTSHFMEFLGEDGRPRLGDELAVGSRYSVVLTTGGGLARYALGDEVEAVAPGSIEFVGRSGTVSDLCGEKLSEAFVARILEDAAGRFEWGAFAMLAPQWGRPPRYALFLESGSTREAAAYVEERLLEAFHYGYCRRLGQLGPVEAVPVPDANDRYLDACRRMGQRHGNVKPAWLRKELGWRERLEGKHAG
jgi:hypothetical protein